jgi:hypothetical protein
MTSTISVDSPGHRCPVGAGRERVGEPCWACSGRAEPVPAPSDRSALDRDVGPVPDTVFIAPGVGTGRRSSSGVQQRPSGGRHVPGPQPSVPSGRRHCAGSPTVSGVLECWELVEAAGDVVLLASELVTNGVVHARSRLIVTVAVADGLLEIGVSDHDPRAPRVLTRVGDPGQPIETTGAGADLAWLAAGGRGLGLVDNVAAEWGVANLATGKQVWFRFAVAQSWPYSSACPCRRTDLARTRLDSGRYAVSVPGRWDEHSPYARAGRSRGQCGIAGCCPDCADQKHPR